jgi:hypothetical protein|tara:strand:+ start:422 stop:958 length:537 start_codon:yes stop_codon:yes gene_type:complete
MKTENLERYLNSFAQQVVNDSKKLLQSKKGSTALGKSIRAKVTTDPNGYSVKFYMADYGTFLDKGVSGNKNPISYSDGTRIKSSPYKYTTKGPPIDILSKWIKKKGIKPKGLGKGRSKNTGQYVSGFAYLISKKIKREGIKSISFFSRPLGVNYKELQGTLLKEFKQDVSTYITTFTK